jgi:3-dehydroquinate synthase
VALGGGVVSDLAGFVGATWMRGVQWAICPTTLEAMIDASIGGKTAVNVPGGKNLVGAFHHPRMVLIDPDCLVTLLDRDLRAGLAESIKHAALFSPEFFEWHEQNAEAILRRESQVLSELIDRNVAIKVDVVRRDATEQSGRRMLLNFGHTIGHAIEECCGYELRHGECVALGMVAAATLSESLGLSDASVAEQIRGLANCFQLPTHLPSAIPWPRVLEVMRRDKKAREGKLQFVLLQAIGKPAVRRDVDEWHIRQAYEALIR